MVVVTVDNGMVAVVDDGMVAVVDDRAVVAAGGVAVDGVVDALILTTVVEDAASSSPVHAAPISIATTASTTGRILP
ncbi:MAG: hypothetical protein ABIP17_08645 [Ilumatobacteraceae bacterium]